jgi:hypothetical protein
VFLRGQFAFASLHLGLPRKSEALPPAPCLASIGSARQLSKCRRLRRFAVRVHQPGDARKRSQIFQVDVVDLDAEVEVLLELEEQLHELERIQNAGLEQIGIRGRYFDVECIGEQSAKALDGCIAVSHLLFLFSMLF